MSRDSQPASSTTTTGLRLERSRTQARVLALQALTLFDAQGDSFEKEIDTFLSDTVAQVDAGLPAPVEASVVSFARSLASDAWNARKEYDRLIEEAVPEWRVARLARVDRNLLRLGLHELFAPRADAPPQVVINEAIELAKHFGSADTPGFINGILDAIRKRHLAPPSG